jgi:hypothetical protein
MSKSGVRADLIAREPIDDLIGRARQSPSKAAAAIWSGQLAVTVLGVIVANLRLLVRTPNLVLNVGILDGVVAVLSWITIILIRRLWRRPTHRLIALTVAWQLLPSVLSLATFFRAEEIPRGALAVQIANTIPDLTLAVLIAGLAILAWNE